jgi:hypothetical protein
VEAVELPPERMLIPVDEVERLLGERRRLARERRKQTTPGRPPVVTPGVVRPIRVERAAGKPLPEIAGDLNANGTPTATAAQWWPAMVRAVLRHKITD